MKNYQHLLFTAVCMLFATTLAFAQAPSLPSPSPGAEAMQTVGLTEVKVTYSSPGVKGRKIWGGLEKFGKVWRAGAGPATKVSFSTDVKINNTDIKKGAYVLMLDLKDENNWEWILATKGSAFGFKKENVVLRTKAVVTKGLRNKERLTYYISADKANAGTVNLRWEKAEISFGFTTEIKPTLMANVKKFAGQSNWFNLGNSGYQIIVNSDDKKDIKLATGLINASVAMAGENMINSWWKTELLAKKGKTSEAKKMAKKVEKLYAKEKRNGWKNFYKANIKPSFAKATWK